MSTTKPAIPNSTITRDVRELDKTTDNIYESIVIISKRANQISNNLKEELHGKLAEFASSNDNLEEIFEEHGGEKVQLVPSSNDHVSFIDCVTDLIKERL
jgi:protoheme ferro-lyase